MDSPKITSDHIVEYFNFLFDFLKNPRASMADYAEPDPKTHQTAIRGKLAFYAIVSVAMATLFVQIGAAIGMAPDSSSSIVVLNKIGVIALPFVALVSIIIVSAIAHALVKLVSLVGQLTGHQLFDGDVKNSVNAALAFSSLIIPLSTLAIVILRIIAAQQSEASTILLIAIVAPVSLSSWVYLVGAFAGVHKLSWSQAIYLFGATVVVIMYASKIVSPSR